MRYAYLGPAGTFTEAALLSVAGAREAERLPVSSVPVALAAVRSGEVDAAMVPIENSVEGGVTATLDAVATGSELRIVPGAGHGLPLERPEQMAALLDERLARLDP